MGFGVDVTDRKRAEAALAESEARFARIFQASPVALGMATIDDGRMIDVNASWLELFGYDRDEVIGRTNADLGLSVDSAARAALARRALQDGYVRNAELQVRRKSGEVRDLILSAVAVDLPTPHGAWLTAQFDITDRKRAEDDRARLLASESRARAAAEAALDRLRAIQTITDSALQHLGVDELLQELLGRLRATLAADSAMVLLLDEHGTTLLPRAVSGETPPQVQSFRLPVGKGAAGRAVAEGRALIVEDYSTIDASGAEGVSEAEIRTIVESCMVAPLRVGDRILGVVGLASRTHRRFEEADLELLRLVADRMAPNIESGLLLETVRAGRERLEALSRRLLTAQEEERRHLAVELHDELGQVLTAVKINLASVERLPGAPAAQVHLRDAIASVDHAMEWVRDLALDLRPSVLDDLGLPAALRWYVDRFARSAGLDIAVSIDAVPCLEPGIETACFRVAQEALTNVARHARAARVWLDLHLLSDGLELRVRDDGAGFDPTRARERAAGGASVGLLGMHERVSLAGGELEVLSGPGRGTEVRAHFGATRPRT
jgi:PAS domain S-box-containing protein